ncbi:hypothetical protein WA026_011023 [Henosepilachna vigintioctopunctata]|uniref:Uncharacterized protein n=1 Tax=Henosepilachna vigintioctopunctata TaxID=420089 RepID=A0AAW1V003_9CUCU
MTRRTSIVQFSEKLDILSSESIPTEEKAGSFNETKQTLNEEIEEEEDKDHFQGNEDYLPIRVEYTTKRDSTEMNRCLVTPKPPRRHVPVFWKRGTDSVNIGYTLKTNFIGDTKIISVAPTGKLEQSDEFDDFIFRNSFIGRSLETLRREADVSSDDLLTKRKSLTENVEKIIKTNKQDHTENVDTAKLKFSKKQPMNEFYSASFKKFLISDGNRDKKSATDQEDLEGYQISVHPEVATKYPKHTGPSQGPVVKTMEDKSQRMIVEDINTRQEVDEKSKDIIPLEKKLIELLQNTNPESKLIHRRVPFKETRKLQFIQKNDIEPPGMNKLLIQRPDFVRSIDNDKYPKRGILTRQKPLDALKVSSSFSKFKKQHSKSSLSQYEKISKKQESVASFHGKMSKNSKKGVILFSPRAETGTGTFLVNQSKSSEDFSFNERKDLIVTNTLNKPSPFRMNRFVVDDSNEFLKRPVQLSLKIIQNDDGKREYKIIAKKNHGLKNEYDIFTKQLKLPRGLQQLPQIAAPKNDASIDERSNKNSEIEGQHRLNLSAKSSEVQEKLRLPVLNTPHSTSVLHQYKKNASGEISQSEHSPSLLKFRKSKSLVKIDRKSKLKEKLSLQSNLSRLNQMKEQISSSSRRKLIKPDETEIVDSVTKLSTFKDSHLIENVEIFTKKSVALLSQSNQVNETRNKSDGTNTKEHDFNTTPKNKFNIVDHSEDVDISSAETIEKEIESVDHIVEQVSSQEQSEPSGGTSVGKYKSDNGEEEGMTTSYTSTSSSDILMKIDSESLENMVKEYLLSNFTYGEEETEMEDMAKYTKYSDDKISVHQEETEVDSPKFEYNYRGTYDVHNLRSGFGCFHWDASESRTYCGFFLYNSLHGKGHYFIKEDKCLNFYNGHLYGNELYGYGQIVHDNADKFEGLFKNNSRYGPGVFTHKNGTQDVGLWYGNSLFRLNVDLSRCIPSFGRSMFGKIKLLNFRKTIRLKTYHREKGRQILENLTSDPKILARYKELYNPYVRNQNSLFFNRSEYDGEYFKNEECYVSIFKSLKKHKTISDGFSTKTVEENEGKMSEEHAELIKTIENVQTKLTNFRNQIDELQTKQEIELAMTGSATSPTNILDDAQKNKLYKEELFYNSVLEFLNYKLNRYEQVSFSGLSTMDQKVRVNSLLAWNNNDILVDMLLHTFRCRSSEENVSFEVKPIIRGERKLFAVPGENEELCTEFLENCRTGDDKNALVLLFKSNINPDVCDSRGNTGLHLATCFDHVNTIKVLANNGANLNITNDEGLIPLNLALLRYLAIIYNVHRWEFGFLSEHEVSSNEKDSFRNGFHMNHFGFRY